MEKDLRIKQLKKELLELEGREMKDEAKASNDKVVSGLILIAIGGISLTYGLGYEIVISTIAGIIAVVIGIWQMNTGKSSLTSFEDRKKVKEERVIIIKKELLDLE
jgi:hypothetical protein